MILRKCISVFSLICLVVSSNFESESVKGRGKARSSSAVSKRYIWISGFVISACMLGGLLYFYCCNPSDIVNVMPDDLSNQITGPVVKVPDITDHVVNHGSKVGNNVDHHYKHLSKWYALGLLASISVVEIPIIIYLFNSRSDKDKNTQAGREVKKNVIIGDDTVSERKSDQQNV